MNDECIKTCRKLCSLVAPSGKETAVASYICEALSKNSNGIIKIDMMGNIIFSFIGMKSYPPVALLAHMDSAGLFTMGTELNNRCRYGSLSTFCKEKADKKLFKFLSGAEAVVDYENRTLIRQGSIPLRPGDFGTFFPSFDINTKEVYGTFLDNRVICALLLDVIFHMTKTERTVNFIFTVQEEVGNKGARALAPHIEADRVYILDTTACDVIMPSSIPVLDNGVCIKICDGSGFCSSVLNDEVLRLSHSRGISLQLEALDFAGSDISAFSGTRADLLFTGLSIPCSNMHSNNERMSLYDIDEFDKLLHIILEDNCGAEFKD